VIRGGDGETVVPVAFIGAEGHGAIYIDRAQAAADGDPGAGGSGWPGSADRCRRRCSGWPWAASGWRYPRRRSLGSGSSTIRGCGRLRT
jgi:hypothetical protein